MGFPMFHGLWGPPDEDDVADVEKTKWVGEHPCANCRRMLDERDEVAPGALRCWWCGSTTAVGE